VIAITRPYPWQNREPCGPLGVMTWTWRGAVARVVAVSALVAVAWMHGATVPSSAVCVSHEAPTGVAASHGSMATDGPLAMASAGLGDQALPGAPARLAGAEQMGPHGLMACIAILVALLALSAPGWGRSRPSLRLADQWRARLPMVTWPKPPDLMVLSILRT
jgi:hypothetical protein